MHCKDQINIIKVRLFSLHDLKNSTTCAHNFLIYNSVLNYVSLRTFFKQPFSLFIFKFSENSQDKLFFFNINDDEIMK